MDDDRLRNAPSVPGAPSDNTTLTEVLESFELAGFGGQFVAEHDGFVRCSHCATSFPASRLVVERARRLEGASDPADMVRVIAARCGSCDRRATLVLGFGPTASEDDADVASALIVAPQVTDRA